MKTFADLLLKYAEKYFIVLMIVVGIFILFFGILVTSLFVLGILTLSFCIYSLIGYKRKMDTKKLKEKNEDKFFKELELYRVETRSFINFLESNREKFYSQESLKNMSRLNSVAQEVEKIQEKYIKKGAFKKHLEEVGKESLEEWRLKTNVIDRFVNGYVNKQTVKFNNELINQSMTIQLKLQTSQAVAQSWYPLFNDLLPVAKTSPGFIEKCEDFLKKSLNFFRLTRELNLGNKSFGIDLIFDYPEAILKYINSEKFVHYSSELESLKVVLCR